MRYLDVLVLQAAAGNVGDNNHALGVQGALKIRELDRVFIKKVATHTVTKSADFLSEYNMLREEVQSLINIPHTVLVIAAGSWCIKYLSTLKTEFSNHIFISWGAHELPEVNLEEIKTFDSITLPITYASAASLSDVKSKVVFTLGVPHNLTQPLLDKEYEKFSQWRNNIAASRLSDSSNSLLLILGGDVSPPPLEYTTEEVEKIANYIAKNYHNYYVYVVNGPRTGQHCQGIGVQKPHDYHENLEQPSEKVSEYCLQILQNNGMQFFFSDFVRLSDSNSPLPYDLYKSVLSKVDLVFVAGDSTSMISDALDFCKNVTVYYTTSMTDKHINTVQTLRKYRYFTMLDTEMTELQNNALRGETYELAAEVVATHIQKLLHQHSIERAK